MDGVEKSAEENAEGCIESNVKKDLVDKVLDFFEGAASFVRQEDYQSYSFLRVKPIKGSKEIPKGSFAIKKEDGIVYRIAGYCGAEGQTKQGIIIEEIPEDAQKVVNYLAYRLKSDRDKHQEQHISCKYAWRNEEGAYREANASSFEPDECRVAMRLPPRLD